MHGPLRLPRLFLEQAPHAELCRLAHVAESLLLGDDSAAAAFASTDLALGGAGAGVGGGGRRWGRESLATLALKRLAGEEEGGGADADDLGMGAEVDGEEGAEEEEQQQDAEAEEEGSVEEEEAVVDEGHLAHEAHTCRRSR